MCDPPGGRGHGGGWRTSPTTRPMAAVAESGGAPGIRGEYGDDGSVRAAGVVAVLAVGVAVLFGTRNQGGKSSSL